jgi:release factor glutamine methyltransferase
MIAMSLERGGAHAVTVQEALAGCALPPREARALLALCMGAERERLVAHPELPVAPAALARFEAMASERRRGVPIAYLLGYQEFHGHRFTVTPDVLVPRPETELLVDTVLQLLHGKAAARVLDLGTGSGCIAISLALARPGLAICATDRSPAALDVARGNAQHLGASGVTFVAGNWYAPVDETILTFDVIVSNPPYVHGNDVHLEQLTFEPRAALTDGGDGLSALREIIAGADARLAAGGHVLVEHGYDQGPAVRALMHDAGLAEVVTLRDLEGRERACMGSKRRVPGERAP